LKKFILLFLIFIFSSNFHAQPEFTEMSSKPGSFSRMGFGPRGIAMGNAMASVITGNLVSYYNPAVIVFQEGNNIQSSYSFLTLDRSLNFLNFTRRFDFRSSKDTTSKPRSTAGFSAGIINSGVSGIDGRDNQGLKTGDLSTSENQFFIAVANKFSEKISVGLGIKFYYYSLYDEVSSTSVGFDFGIIYKHNKNLTLAFVLTDLLSKYKWDTTPTYDQLGNITEDEFPLIKKLGITYILDDYNLLTSVEFENSVAGTNYLKIGLEYKIYQNLFLRAGIDRFNLSNQDEAYRPALGISFDNAFDFALIGFDYAFIFEPYSNGDHHLIGVNFNF